MYAAYPGSYTDPQNWIVQSAMRGWEFVEGTTHHAVTGTSGQTDASALRHLGIPTVRLGYPQRRQFGGDTASAEGTSR